MNIRLGNLDLGLQRKERIRKLLALPQCRLDDLPVRRIAQKVGRAAIHALVRLDGRGVRVAVLGLAVGLGLLGRRQGRLVGVDGDHLLVAIALGRDGAHGWAMLVLEYGAVRVNQAYR